MTSRERACAGFQVKLPNAECFRLNDRMFGEEMQANNITNLIFNSQTARNRFTVSICCYMATQMADTSSALPEQTHAH